MSLLIKALIPALSLFIYSSGVSAQITEQEPNNPCPSAQDLGEAMLSFFINGSLDSTEEVPDVDFYRVTGMPGQLLQIDLQGASAGAGSLGDPYLGFFNSACELLAVDDDGGGQLNSRLFVNVPDDGVYVLGATNCCDGEFNGGGMGTYTLTVSSPAIIGSIAGRAVDADTYAPLPGDVPPFAWAELRSCDIYGCYQWVSSQAAGPDGTFLFTTNNQGLPLVAGTYEVSVQAEWYEQALSGPFDVAEDEAFDLGDVPLLRVALIGAINGRLVDALDGSPLPGSSPPFANTTLERCEAFGCYPVLYNFPTDDQGYFRFEGMPYGFGPGDYRIVASADDYYPFATDPFYVGDREVAELGDLGLMPLPIFFGEVTGCEVLPLGGVCDFSVQITNRGPGRYRGEAWAIARYFTAEFPNRQNRFQIGRMGADNPNPQRINLTMDQTATLSFKLKIPATAAADTYLCVTANIGRDPSPQFDAVGDRLLFCAYTQADGTMLRLSDKESRRQLRELGKHSR